MNTLFKNTLISSLDLVVLIGLGIVLTPVLVSNFGIAEYGVFVFFGMFSFYGALSFFDFGMEGALMTLVSKFDAENNNEKLVKVTIIAIYYYSIIGCFLGGAFYFLSDLIVDSLVNKSDILNKNQIIIASHWVVINIIIQFMTLPATAILKGLRNFYIVKTISMLMNSLHYLVIIFIAIYFSRIDYVFSGIVFISLLRFISNNLALYRKTLKDNDLYLSVDRGVLNELLKSCNSLFINRVIGLIANNLDKLLIFFFLNISKIAVYDVVTRPSMLIRVVVSMLYSAVIPEVARLNRKEERHEIKVLMVRLIRYAYLIVFPLATMISVHASELLYLWVGNDFTRYDNLVTILIIASIVNPFASIVSTMLVGLDMVKRTLWIPLLSTAINAIFSFIFVNFYGLTGLLFSTLISQVIALICYYIFVQSFFDISIHDILLPTFYLTILSFVFYGLHYSIHAVYQSGAFNWIMTIFILVICQYLISFIFFVKPSEKEFLTKKIKLLANIS